MGITSQEAGRVPPPPAPEPPPVDDPPEVEEPVFADEPPAVDAPPTDVGRLPPVFSVLAGSLPAQARHVTAMIEERLER